MDRQAKVELFEQIRREYDYGVGTIKGVARKLGSAGAWYGKRWGCGSTEAKDQHVR